MIEENNMKAEAQAVNTQPEDNGNNAAGKTFTQDEVNTIIRERLARERAKADTPTDNREQSIIARESRLDCREYINAKEYPAKLLDIFDTANIEQFKESVDKLIEAFPSIVDRKPIGGTGGAGNFPRRHEPIGKDLVAEAFKPKI